jgi:threonyl-tRNA synthetase
MARHDQQRFAASHIISRHLGRRWRRYPVVVTTYAGKAQSPAADLDTWLNPTTVKVEVIADSTAAAANLVRDEWSQVPETTIRAYGPKGGEVERYVGYFSAVAAGLGVK